MFLDVFCCFGFGYCFSGYCIIIAVYPLTYYTYRIPDKKKPNDKHSAYIIVKYLIVKSHIDYDLTSPKFRTYNQICFNQRYDKLLIFVQLYCACTYYVVLWLYRRYDKLLIFVQLYCACRYVLRYIMVICSGVLAKKLEGIRAFKNL